MHMLALTLSQSATRLTTYKWAYVLITFKKTDINIVKTVIYKQPIMRHTDRF